MLWAEAPIPTAATALQGYVGQLRKLLGNERLVTEGSSYLLRVGDGEVDADRFEALLAQGRTDDALGLWRGPALVDCRDEPFAQAEIGRLEELRLVALERRLEAKLEGGGVGGAAEAASDLAVLVAEHPLRERLPFLLMLSLYRSGRQAEALEVFQGTRRVLVDELGIEPSSELVELQRRILIHDPLLAAPPERATKGEPAAQEERKTLTVLACQLVDSSALGKRLDPEALRSRLERFAAACAEVFERHGGEAAEVSREGVVGAFSLSRTHEDDALRALRAAVELPAVLEPLELGARIGVATGEIFRGPDSAPLVGDALDLALRLQEHGTPGVVLMDDETYARCRDAVTTRTRTLGVDSTRKVSAHLLLELVAGAPTFRRRFDTPLIGRERELGDLRYLYERVVRDRTPSVVTVLGAPGIGKTRLAREFALSLGEEAQVLVGQCLPYGEGAGIWPLREIVLGGGSNREQAGRIAEMLAGEDDAPAVARVLAVAAGLTDGESTHEETLWATKRFVETLASRRPLVVIAEDVHWADEAFLGLLEHVVDFVRDVPVLLICLARPQLAEDRPEWLGRKRESTTLSLAELSVRESRALVDHLAHDADPDVRRRVVDIAGGNPLFAEQLLAHALEHGGEVTTPATIHALLASRIDTLRPAERGVLQAAAVVGEEFGPGSIAQLVPEEAAADVRDALASLVHRDLVRPVPSRRTESSFRFGHRLVRDTAYEMISKRSRARLHARFAEWLEQESPAESEIVGHHLERAHDLLVEIDGADAATRELGLRAAERLGAAGRQAQLVGRLIAADALLVRALKVVPTDDPLRARLLIDRGKALAAYARTTEACAAFAECVELAERLGEPVPALRAELLLLSHGMMLEGSAPEELDRRARAAALEFEANGDDLAAYEAWLVVHSSLYYRGLYGAALEALERAVPHGRKAGALEARIVSRPMILHLYGPSPSSLGLARAEVLLADGNAGPVTRADALAYGGVLHAMRGNEERGREWVETSMQIWRDAGTHEGVWLGELAGVQVLAEDWRSAEQSLRAQCASLDEPGRGPVFATYAAWLAHVLYELKRDDEALQWAESSGERAAAFDLPAQADWRAAKAKVLARGGSHVDAEALARGAVELASRADALWQRGNTSLDLAEVLLFAGKPDAAVSAIDDASRCYDQKEHLVGATRARTLLTKVEQARRRRRTRGVRR